MRLILASASPRRAELLTTAGIDFEVVPAAIDETPQPHETPTAYVLRVARDKAAAVVTSVDGSAAVLGADTIVVAQGRLLGKPSDAAEARQMLQLLSGTVHEVHTGVVLMVGDRETAEVATTRVRFLPMTDDEIEAYIASAEPEGKAGAYAIQGRASRYVEWIEGSWSNVVGLPVATVYRMIRQAGVIS